MFEPTDKDWCSAACADALIENLPIQCLQAAHDVSKTPQEFWFAIQGAIALRDVVGGARRGEREELGGKGAPPSN